MITYRFTRCVGVELSTQSARPPNQKKSETEAPTLSSQAKSLLAGLSDA
jgi:hypothetical protein